MTKKKKADGICYACWREEDAERARKGKWTPSFAVDMGPNKPCRKHGGKGNDSE